MTGCRAIALIITILLIALLSCCTVKPLPAYNYVYGYDKENKTFNFQPCQGHSHIVEYEIHRRLTSQGFKMDDNPDVLVCYSIYDSMSLDIIRVVETGGRKHSDREKRDFKNVVLMISLIDREDSSVFWQGFSEDVRNLGLRKSVWNIMNKFTVVVY